MRKLIVENLIAPRVRQPSEHQAINLSCALMGIEIGVEPMEIAGFSGFATKALVTAIHDASTKYTTGERQYIEKVAALTILISRLNGSIPEKEAMEGIEDILRLIEFDAPWLQLPQSLCLLIDKMPPAKVQATFQLVVEKMKEWNVPPKNSALSSLIRGLASLNRRLPAPEADLVIVQILACMADHGNIPDLESMAEGLAHLAAMFPAESAKRLVTAIENTENPYVLAHIADALSHIAGSLDPRDTEMLHSQVLERMERGRYKHPFDFLWWARGLRNIPGELRTRDAQKAFSLIFAAMKQQQGPRELSALAEGIMEISGQLSPTVANCVVACLKRNVGDHDPPERLGELAKAIGNVSARFRLVEDQSVTARVLSVIRETSDPKVVLELSEAHRAVPGGGQ